jgi:hypothetical protein
MFLVQLDRIGNLDQELARGIEAASGARAWTDGGSHSIMAANHHRRRVGGYMQVVATGYGLIEGPVWDPAKGL